MTQMVGGIWIMDHSSKGHEDVRYSNVSVIQIQLSMRCIIVMQSDIMGSKIQGLCDAISVSGL